VMGAMGSLPWDGLWGCPPWLWERMVLASHWQVVVAAVNQWEHHQAIVRGAGIHLQKFCGLHLRHDKKKIF